LLKGSFVKTEGWAPSYFATDLGNVSRVNIIGVVVSNELAGGVILDDGSGRILLRSFEENAFEKLSIGDLIMVVGRPRVYNEQKYVLPEIIKKISQDWATYRQAQLEILRRQIKVVKREIRTPIRAGERPINYFQKITNFIKDLDAGSGADIEEVIKRSSVPDADALIRKLIEEGEVFEIRPGKLKLLD